MNLNKLAKATSMAALTLGMTFATSAENVFAQNVVNNSTEALPGTIITNGTTETATNAIQVCTINVVPITNDPTANGTYCAYKYYDCQGNLIGKGYGDCLGLTSAQ